jgi:hypothetical protein
MELPVTEDAVRDQVEKAAKQEFDARTAEFNAKVDALHTSLGGDWVGDRDALAPLLDRHDILVAPRPWVAAHDAIKHLTDVVSEIKNSVARVISINGSIQSEEDTVSVSVCSDFEQPPASVVKAVVAALLNVRVTASDAVEPCIGVDDNDNDTIVHEWKVAFQGWVDAERGKAFERQTRIKRARDTIAECEDRIATEKKRLTELGVKSCGCPDS